MKALNKTMKSLIQRVKPVYYFYFVCLLWVVAASLGKGDEKIIFLFIMAAGLVAVAAEGWMLGWWSKREKQTTKGGGS